jgi:hypothetical protein
MALEAAASRLAQDGVVEIEPVIDRDTQGVTGAPDIGVTILSKIDVADAFVADVTIVNAALGGRPTPNPNVLIELGYALKALGPERIVLVQNTTFGGPELLPFDLRQKRVLGYESAEDSPERAPARRHLQTALETALGAILRRARPERHPVAITIGYKKESIESDIHHYRLDVCVANTSKKRLDDWEIEVEFPTPVLERNVTVGVRIASRSNGKRSLFRVAGKELGQPIRPGEEKHVGWGYFVDDEVYGRRADIFDEPVKVRVLIDGEIAAEAERPFGELQCF